MNLDIDFYTVYFKDYKELEFDLGRLYHLEFDASYYKSVSRHRQMLSRFILEM